MGLPNASMQGVFIPPPFQFDFAKPGIAFQFGNSSPGAVPYEILMLVTCITGAARAVR
jgi:hypothetical protein